MLLHIHYAQMYEPLSPILLLPSSHSLTLAHSLFTHSRMFACMHPALYLYVYALKF